MYTWCEERGAERGTKKTSGDRQHLWTPFAVVRFVRDALVMERGDSLHLAMGSGRSWLAAGKSVGVKNAPTHFGNVSYQLDADAAGAIVRVQVDPPHRIAPKEIVLHVQRPSRTQIKTVLLDGDSRLRFDAERELVYLPTTRRAPFQLEVHY